MDFQSGAVAPTMGLNDNLDFMGKELHIQTENVKSVTSSILTQVFFRGRVIHTTKQEYSTEAQEFNDFGKIRDLMHAQHLKVIENISKLQMKLNKQSQF